jgi:RimJ/RimL family protein N-acetyltransferase
VTASGLRYIDHLNRQASFGICIGAKDAWGQGHGTEATRLMLDHAFGTLSLHRIGLSVFSFNERAIRSYRSCGFVMEGRAREAIWRDGRWWDEVTMSVLYSDWLAMQEPEADAAAVDGNGSHRSIRQRPTAGFLGRRR